MIRYLKGQVAYINADNLVLDVNGVGYQVYVGRPNDFTLEKTIQLHTYQVVRETALDLYGFISLDELEIFELLLGLPKIGPKSAASIMAQADLPLLKEAVLNNDPNHLSKLSGMGKKTAEKVVAGLKDKFEDLGFTALSGAVANEDKLGFQTDTIDALVTLGYPQADARKVVLNLPENITNTNEAVSAALKVLSQGS